MKYIGLLLSLLLISCASNGDKIEGLDRSITDLQRLADQSLPVDRASVSTNGREFYSAPFIKDQGGFKKVKEAKAHMVAVIKVLGDRRPYSIEVTVLIQKRQASGDYLNVGYDKGLARVISRRIQKELYQRRERRNIIDDFKVF